MTQLTYTVPTVGNPDTTEEPLIVTALTAIKNAVNGNLDAANLSSSAGITLGQLASLLSGKIIVGNGSNVPTAVTPSGDVTISNTGVVTIGSGKITTSKILDDNVTDDKISLGTPQTDDSSNTNPAAATWTNTTTSLQAASDGTYLITCTGRVTHSSTAVTTVNFQSRLVQNLTVISGSTQSDIRVADGSIPQSVPFSHFEIIELALNDVINHQIYSGISGANVAAGGFNMKMLKIANS